MSKTGWVSNELQSGGSAGDQRSILLNKLLLKNRSIISFNITKYCDTASVAGAQPTGPSSSPYGMHLRRPVMHCELRPCRSQGQSTVDNVGGGLRHSNCNTYKRKSGSDIRISL